MAGVGALLTALGDEKRRGVVEALAGRRASAGELAVELDVTPALLTRHLRVLRDVEVVRVALDPEDHRRHVYELVPDPLWELRDWADHLAAFWSDQLGSFVAYAGRSHHEPVTDPRRRAERRADR